MVTTTPDIITEATLAATKAVSNHLHNHTIHLKHTTLALVGSIKMLRNSRNHLFWTQTNNESDDEKINNNSIINNLVNIKK